MKENQDFKTLDAIVAITMAIVLAATLAKAAQAVFSDTSIQMAQIQAEKIAAQILSGVRPEAEIELRAESLGRKVASVSTEKVSPLELLGTSGQISKDPWWQPYSFRILSGGKGKKIAVVWSMGPDQRSDTPESIVSRHERSLTAEKIIFGGDDLGVVLSGE